MDVVGAADQLYEETYKTAAAARAKNLARDMKRAEIDALRAKKEEKNSVLKIAQAFKDAAAPIVENLSILAKEPGAYFTVKEHSGYDPHAIPARFSHHVIEVRSSNIKPQIGYDINLYKNGNVEVCRDKLVALRATDGKGVSAPPDSFVYNGNFCDWFGFGKAKLENIDADKITHVVVERLVANGLYKSERNISLKPALG